MKNDKIVSATLYFIYLFLLLCILLLIFVQPIKDLIERDKQITNIQIKLDNIKEEYNEIISNYIQTEVDI